LAPGSASLDPTQCQNPLDLGKSYYWGPKWNLCICREFRGMFNFECLYRGLNHNNNAAVAADYLLLQDLGVGKTGGAGTALPPVSALPPPVVLPPVVPPVHHGGPPTPRPR